MVVAVLDKLLDLVLLALLVVVRVVMAVQLQRPQRQERQTLVEVVAVLVEELLREVAVRQAALASSSFVILLTAHHPLLQQATLR